MREVLRLHVVGELERAIEHLPVLGHDDEQRAARAQGHERDLADVQRHGGRRQHDGQAVREARERGRGLFQQVVELFGAASNLLDGLFVGALVGKLPFEQLVNESAVPDVGGDAAGRGVRLRDVAFVLEHGELVADGGRGHAQPIPFGQGARPDGQRVRHVLFD